MCTSIRRSVSRPSRDVRRSWGCRGLMRFRCTSHDRQEPPGCAREEMGARADDLVCQGASFICCPSGPSEEADDVVRRVYRKRMRKRSTGMSRLRAWSWGRPDAGPPSHRWFFNAFGPILQPKYVPSLPRRFTTSLTRIPQRLRPPRRRHRPGLDIHLPPLENVRPQAQLRRRVRRDRRAQGPVLAQLVQSARGGAEL